MNAYNATLPTTLPSGRTPRKLRVFAFDPAFNRKYQNRFLRHVTIKLPWDFDPIDVNNTFKGPIGEYLEVIDYDPASDVFYSPIDLNDLNILLEKGLTPSEENPQFHQQMVYAVVMHTIANFEEALGRRVLWSPRKIELDGKPEFQYIQRLRIYPHALRAANAYYSPAKKALLFGYFDTKRQHDDLAQSTTIFTCLSQDVIVHEASHAILDGMHPSFINPTNPDVLALHEAFSDIVAIFQHFSFAEVLKDQIALTRGDLEKQNLLGELAQEFGQALGYGKALRSALGTRDEQGSWQPLQPNSRVLETTTSPHARGAILVAAVFRAFLSVYKGRIADLIRIASMGTGILPKGEIHPDLVNRMADEAAKSARHVLQMCIRALDYCPPVNISFGDYFRAIITADFDLYPEDELHYRHAVIEAFLAWGIIPRGMPIVTEKTLLWPTLLEITKDKQREREELESDLLLLITQPNGILNKIKKGYAIKASSRKEVVRRLEDYANQITEKLKETMWERLKQKNSIDRYDDYSSSIESILSGNLLELGLKADRHIEWLARQFYAILFWSLITTPEKAKLAKLIGLTLDGDAPPTVSRSSINDLPAVEVHSVRMATRRGRRELFEKEYVVELVQHRTGYLDPEIQRKADQHTLTKAEKRDAVSFKFVTGCTLLIDADSFKVRRVIRTAGTIADTTELHQVREYLREQRALSRNAFRTADHNSLNSETFANLHTRFHGGQ